MTLTTRRILFYCAIVIFIGVSYVVLIYAQGYKYSFNEQQFIRTGALYLKINTSASILVNNKPVASTSLLGNSASVGGLLPATYTVNVQKEGWSVWHKKITITAGFVEDFSHIMILPQIGQDKENVRQEIHDLLYPVVASSSISPSPSPTSKKIKSTPTPSLTPDKTKPYYMDNGSLYVNTTDGSAVRIAGNVTAVPSDDGQKLAWFSDNQLWVYWFTDTNYQPVHYAGDVALVAHFTYPIKTIRWFRDSDHIALDASGFKIIEIDTRPGLNIINF